MKLFRYIVLSIHILAVIIAMIFTLTSDHLIVGKGFKKALQEGNFTYLTEEASNFSVLYKGDYLGTILNVYKSNQGESGVLIEDFDVKEDVYLLLKKPIGYEIKKISYSDFSGISKSETFLLNDIDSITDFYVNLSDNMAYITAISGGKMSASVYSVNLQSFVMLGLNESKDSDEMPPELPAQYRYESGNGIISTAYYDGFNIITDAIRPDNNIKDAASYSRGLELTIGQSFNVNSFIFVIYLAYLILGIIVITLIYNLIEKRRRFIDLILINEIFILIFMCVAMFMFSDILLPVIFAVIVSIVNIAVILIENRDIRVLCENMKRIGTGSFDIEKPSGNSLETSILYRGMNEVRYLYEQYKYIQETNTAAAIRFLPRNISSMFKSGSLDEIKPGDSTSISGSIMVLKTGNEITNDLVSLVEKYENDSKGTLLTGECSLSELKVLFSSSKDNEVSLGLSLHSEMCDNSASLFYYKDNFKISVVGTATKSILNVSSSKTEAMERLASWFFEMGIKMVITEDIKDKNVNLGPTRFIGYSNINGEKINFYEVLNAYDENIRSNKLRCVESFDNAIKAMYQDNYYIARTAFSDILKIDPNDELSRWYLFICEKYLNNPDITDKSCALNPRN